MIDLKKSFQFKEFSDYSYADQLSAVSAIFRWRYTNTNSFENRIIGLFPVADKENLEKLRLGFNLLYEAYCKWAESTGRDGQDLFIQYGLMYG